MLAAPPKSGAPAVTGARLERVSMTQPTPVVRAVHRITLPSDGYGRILPGPLHTEGHPLPDGAVVVLDVGEGWWMHSADIGHIGRALDNVGHITITGVYQTRPGGGGRTAFGTVYGLAAIAEGLTACLGRSI